MTNDAVCTLCPFYCNVSLGSVGKCKVRGNPSGDMVQLLTYGKVSTLIDGPIEQKPLYHYYPGLKVLSIGSFGCNMFCSYCQNFEISQIGAKDDEKIFSPSEIVDTAISRGINAIAFTYSEPIVWFEFIYNVAVNAKKRGLKTILKTNAYCNEPYFSELLEWIDAINIDVKGSQKLYKEVAGIELPEDPNDWIIMKNLSIAAKKCHVEVSTIAIPPYCDEDHTALFLAMNRVAGRQLPLHILRFIPDFKLRDTPPPTIDQLQTMQAKAKIFFDYVYIDFAGIPSITYCSECHTSLVERNGILLLRNRLIRGNRCPCCLSVQNFEG